MVDKYSIRTYDAKGLLLAGLADEGRGGASAVFGVAGALAGVCGLGLPAGCLTLRRGLLRAGVARGGGVGSTGGLAAATAGTTRTGDAANDK
jgi:hypothetical protein